MNGNPQISLEDLRRIFPGAAKSVVLANLPPEQPTQPAKEFSPCEAEIPLHNDIIADCRRRGWLYCHGDTSRRTGRTKGEPDFLVLADRGRKFQFECKDKDGKLSKDQRDYIAQAKKLGHEVPVIRSFQEYLEMVDGQDGLTP